MIQADLRTARMHPDYGMNGLILAAIVIAALASLGALGHVMEGLFFLRRASNSFVRFVSVWDIAFAFVGYLTCAAGLSRHRIFPWLYVVFAIGFSVPRILLEIQAQGIDVGMKAMHEDQSFLQSTHILQVLAVMTWVAAIYVSFAPAVRITYRNRLTRDEERLVEQLQGVDPRLSLGPQGRLREDDAVRKGGREHGTAPDGDHRTMRLPSGGQQPAQRQAVDAEDETVLVRRRARAAASAAQGSEPLPALPSFFQPDTATAGQTSPTGQQAATGQEPAIGHPAATGQQVATQHREQGDWPAAGKDRGAAGADADARAAALAAATVAGALQRVSAAPEAVADGKAQPAAPLPPPARPDIATAAAPPPAGAAPAGGEEPVIVRSGRRRKAAVQPAPEPAAAPAATAQERSVAVGSIIANAGKRTGDAPAVPAPAPASAQWADAGASGGAAMAQAPAPEVAFHSAARSDDRAEAPLLADPAAAGGTTEPASAWPGSAATVHEGAAAGDQADWQHDEAARRQLDAEAERQKLQEELEIDRRIARLRGLASGQVSALSIGLAMDRNPMADDDEQEGMASDGAVRSTTDERLGRLRAAASPPRSRGDSVRRREDQNLSENVSGAVHSLATGDDESEPATAHGGGFAPSRGPGPAVADGGFQSRIDALLSRADASNSWHGGSLPDDVGIGQREAGSGDRQAAAAADQPAPAPIRQPVATPSGQEMPEADMPRHLQPSAGQGAMAHEPVEMPAAATLPTGGVPGLAAAVDFDDLPPAAGLPPGADATVPEPPAALPEAPSAEASPSPPAGGSKSSHDGAAHAADLDAVFGGAGAEEADETPVAGEVPGLAPPPARDLPAEASPVQNDPVQDDPTPEPSAQEPRGLQPAQPLEPDASQAEQSLPQAEPVDQAELARSLADILPAAPAGTPAATGAAGGAPEREGGNGSRVEAAGGGAGAEAASAAAEGAGAAGDAAGSDEDPYVAQRIEAMRILVDEGFMSAEEFARRSAELQAGG